MVLVNLENYSAANNTHKTEKETNMYYTKELNLLYGRYKPYFCDEDICNEFYLSKMSCFSEQRSNKPR